MLKYSIKRILLALLTAFIILTITFFLVKSLSFPTIVTTDKALEIGYYQNEVSKGFLLEFHEEMSGYGDCIKEIKNDNGDMYFFYKAPLMDQYFAWLGRVVTKWDWGVSTYIKPNYTTSSIIMERLPVSLKLNILSVVISVPLGILLGIVAGLNKNNWIDHTISTLVMIFISIPSFVVISFLIYFFAFKGNLPLNWPTSDSSTKNKVLGYIIPVTALSFGSVCGYCRFVRAELCEVMSSEYLLLARTKGLTKRQAIVRHALRNAFVPILPSILAEFIGVFSGSMILENLYNINGIGSLYIDALDKQHPDYNVLMADMAIFITIGLLAGIVLDLSYGFIDPRIRMGEKK